MTKKTEKKGSARKAKKTHKAQAKNLKAPLSTGYDSDDVVAPPSVAQHLIEARERNLNIPARRQRYIKALFGGKPGYFDRNFRRVESSRRAINLKRDIERAHKAAQVDAGRDST